MIADRQTAELVQFALFGTLVTGPARVEELAGGGAEPVHLLIDRRADVVDVDFVGGRIDDEAERVAKALGDEPAFVGVQAGRQRVFRHTLAGFGIDPDQRAAEVLGILSPQRSPLGVRRFLFAADHPGWRVGAGVGLGEAVLTPVDLGEAGALAAARPEVAVGVELEVADRVRGELLAPVRDHRFLGRRFVGCEVCRQAREAALDHAAVGFGPGRFRTGVAVFARVAPVGRFFAGWRVVGVEDVDVGATAGEFRIERQAEQPAVVGVVDLGAKVGEERRRVVFEVVVNEDLARLLADEDLAVGGEPQHGRFFDSLPGFEAFEGQHRVAEAAGKNRFRRGGGGGKARSQPEESENRGDQSRGDEPHARSSGAIVRPAESSCCQ